MKAISEIRTAIESKHTHSAWERGVNAYALELLDGLEEAIIGGYFNMADFEIPRALRTALLNGADSWSQYSYGGSALIYDSDIAERLCCPSELKRNRNGERNPNGFESWLDVQTRALFQAANAIFRAGRG